jgi:hypothetical protein
MHGVDGEMGASLRRLVGCQHAGHVRVLVTYCDAEAVAVERAFQALQQHLTGGAGLNRRRRDKTARATNVYWCAAEGAGAGSPRGLLIVRPAATAS